MTTTTPTLERRPLDQIVPHPDNVRYSFNRDELKQLAVSIATLGVLQPLHVQSSPDGDGTVQIVAGERRWRALQLIASGEIPVPPDSPLDLESIPVQHAAANGEVGHKMLAENMARVDLSPIEEAAGFKRLLDGGMTQKEIGRSVGRSASVISRRVKLLALSPELRAAIDSGLVTLAQADKLAELDPEVANNLLTKNGIEDFSLNRCLAKAEVDRKTEALVRAATRQGFQILDTKDNGHHRAAVATPPPDGYFWTPAEVEHSDEESGHSWSEDATFDSIDDLVQHYLPSDHVGLTPIYGELAVWVAEKLPKGAELDPEDPTDYVSPGEKVDESAFEKRLAKQKEDRAIEGARTRHVKAEHARLAKTTPNAAALTEAVFAHVVARADFHTRVRAAQLLDLDPPVHQQTTTKNGEAATVDKPDWEQAFKDAWAEATTPAAQRKVVQAVMFATAEVASWSKDAFYDLLIGDREVAPFDEKAERAAFRKREKAKAAKAAKDSSADPVEESGEG